MSTGAGKAHLSELKHRLHLTAPFGGRPGARREAVDYTVQARQARARVVNHVLGAAARALAAAARRALVDPVRRARSYDDLRALDDRALQDIGIRRDDAEAIARGTWLPHRLARRGARTEAGDPATASAPHDQGRRRDAA